MMGHQRWRAAQAHRTTSGLLSRIVSNDASAARPGISQAIGMVLADGSTPALDFIPVPMTSTTRKLSQ
jgi:hypothetical protein